METLLTFVETQQELSGTFWPGRQGPYSSIVAITDKTVFSAHFVTGLLDIFPRKYVAELFHVSSIGFHSKSIAKKLRALGQYHNLTEPPRVEFSIGVSDVEYYADVARLVGDGDALAAFLNRSTASVDSLLVMSEPGASRSWPDSMLPLVALVHDRDISLQVPMLAERLLVSCVDGVLARGAVPLIQCVDDRQRVALMAVGPTDLMGSLAERLGAVSSSSGLQDRLACGLRPRALA